MARRSRIAGRFVGVVISSAHRPDAEPETAREAADVENLRPDPTTPDVGRETAAEPAEDRDLARAAMPLSMPLSTLLPLPQSPQSSGDPGCKVRGCGQP
jgi:hypothetical protein